MMMENIIACTYIKTYIHIYTDILYILYLRLPITWMYYIFFFAPLFSSGFLLRNYAHRDRTRLRARRLSAFVMRWYTSCAHLCGWRAAHATRSLMFTHDSLVVRQPPRRRAPNDGTHDSSSVCATLSAFAPNERKIMWKCCLCVCVCFVVHNKNARQTQWNARENPRALSWALLLHTVAHHMAVSMHNKRSA